MPNRGELPIPARRGAGAAQSHAARPDADAWTVIAFCIIGGLLSFYLAVVSVGIDGLPVAMAQQMPWGG
jgi:hypothetical protein